MQGGQCLSSLGPSLVFIIVPVRRSVIHSRTVQGSVFLQQVLGFILPSRQGSVGVVHEDNKGAINPVKNPVASAQLKDIDIWFHSVRSDIREGRIAITLIRSGNQCAGTMTKPIPQEGFVKYSLFTLVCRRYGSAFVEGGYRGKRQQVIHVHPVRTFPVLPFE